MEKVIFLTPGWLDFNKEKWVNKCLEKYPDYDLLQVINYRGYASPETFYIILKLRK